MIVHPGQKYKKSYIATKASQIYIYCQANSLLSFILNYLTRTNSVYLTFAVSLFKLCVRSYRHCRY